MAPEFVLTSKVSIKQIVELVSFCHSFISNLTTLLVAQTEEATCSSVVVLVHIKIMSVPKDNKDENTTDGATDLL